MLTSRDAVVTLCKHCTKTCREQGIDIDLEKRLMLDGSRSRCWSLSITLGEDGIVPVYTIDNRSILLSFYSMFNDGIEFDHGVLCPKICLCHPQNAVVSDDAYSVVLDVLLKNGAKFTYIDKKVKTLVEKQEKMLSVELRKIVADLFAAYKIDHTLSLEECQKKIDDVYRLDRFNRQLLPKYETEVSLCPAGMSNAEELMVWCDMH